MKRRAAFTRGEKSRTPSRRVLTTGELGERAAARWLRWRGFRILARNERTRWGEIDLITRRFGRVAAVEVKTRRDDGSKNFVPLEERLGEAQLERLIAALSVHPASRSAHRLAVDLITVTLRSRGPRRRPRVSALRYLPDLEAPERRRTTH